MLTEAALGELDLQQEATLRLGLGRPDRPENREGGPTSRVFRDRWLDLRVGKRVLRAEETYAHVARLETWTDSDSHERTRTRVGASSRVVFLLEGFHPIDLPEGTEQRTTDQGGVEVEVRGGAGVDRALGATFGQGLAGSDS